MKEYPILFSTEMVKAILEGRKTQTRRVIKPQPWFEPGGDGTYFWKRKQDRFPQVADCPYGQPGDCLWVRETWLPDAPIDGWDGCWEWNGCGRPIGGVPQHYQNPENCIYAATWDGPDLTWKPSIHMPRWASRLTLKIVNIKIERVQEISEENAKAEGVEQNCVSHGWPLCPACRPYGYCLHANEWLDYSTSDDESLPMPSARDSFATLWNRINAKRGFGWEANPFVWVIEFKETLHV